MSTRTRLVLTFEGRFYCSGSVAVRELLQKAYPNSITIKRKLKLVQGQSKQEKLMSLAEKLPQGFALLLIREPRRTRRNVSTYWRYRANQLMPQPQVGVIYG